MLCFLALEQRNTPDDWKRVPSQVLSPGAGKNADSSYIWLVTLVQLLPWVDAKSWGKVVGACKPV